MQVLTFYERQQIAHHLRFYRRIREIGRRLHRDHTVIMRELTRMDYPKYPYDPIKAQKRADRLSHKTNIRKLEANDTLHDHVVAKLKVGRSPEQIAGVLKHHPPPLLKGVTVSHESIYRYIYEGKGRLEYLYPYLRRSHKKRKQKHARKTQKAHILERISIHDRSEAIDRRERFGDWETDSMQFQKQRAGLSVQYERKGMLVRIHKVADKTAQETDHAIRQSIESLPPPLWLSLTFDNGGEGACHTKIRDDYGIETFFCDPYASWQKGGVENINGLIRQYLPKQTDLATVSDEEIETIQERLNDRPRKKLNWLSPNEVLAQASGALNP
jgi:IS30 family transposase